MDMITCIDEFGLGDTIAPSKKQDICITASPPTTYVSFRPDIFSMMHPTDDDMVEEIVFTQSRNITRCKFVTTFLPPMSH